MNIYAWISVAFLALYVLVGFYVSRNMKTLDDFYVMNRQAPFFLITGTLIATNVSSVTLIGYTANSFSIGPLPFLSFYGMTMSASLFLGLYLGRYLYKLKLWTMPDFFCNRYPSEGVRLISTTIVVISMVLFLITVMMGTNVTLKQLFGWDAQVSMLVTLGIITFFTVVGGMKGVVITDTIMFIVFFIGSMALIPYIIINAGGWPQALQTAAEKLPNFVKWTGSKTPFEAFWFYLEMNLMSFILVVASPQLLSRVFIAKDERELGRSMLALAVIMPVFVFGLIYAFGVTPIFASHVKAINIFPWVCLNIAPEIIGGLALAGVVAAALSTASSLFQQAAAALSRDLYQRYINPNVSDQKFMRISQLCVVLVAVIVFIGSTSPQIGEATILYSWLLASSSWAVWTPALVCGVLWKRATKKAAFLSMTLGLVITLAAGIGRQYGYVPSWVAPNIIGLVVSSIIIVLVSLLDKPTDQELEYFQAMRQQPSHK